ncbi:hypothetical protein [Granulicella sp. S156]|uniref:hypothetical protein n=1 Tax=Granulicella sp. S156 TaxID=1747224 RepID=UPI00131B29C5|nr:hypothetical protein [Granulicella sp. S156]
MIGLLYVRANFLVRALPVLVAEHYVKLVCLFMGSRLKTCAFTEVDKEDHLKAWSKTGALTGPELLSTPPMILGAD